MKNDRKRKDDFDENVMHRWAILLLVVGGILTLIAPCIFSMKMGFGNFDANSAYIGDTIGGITAPFIGFLSAILVYFAFRAQIRANKIIQDQFRKDILIKILLKNLEEIDKLIEGYDISNLATSASMTGYSEYWSKGKLALDFVLIKDLSRIKFALNYIEKPIYLNALNKIKGIMDHYRYISRSFSKNSTESKIDFLILDEIYDSYEKNISEYIYKLKAQFTNGYGIRDSEVNKLAKDIIIENHKIVSLFNDKINNYKMYYVYAPNHPRQFRNKEGANLENNIAIYDQAINNVIEVCDKLHYRGDLLFIEVNSNYNIRNENLEFSYDLYTDDEKLREEFNSLIESITTPVIGP